MRLQDFGGGCLISFGAKGHGTLEHCVMIDVRGMVVFIGKSANTNILEGCVLLRGIKKCKYGKVSRIKKVIVFLRVG